MVIAAYWSEYLATHQVEDSTDRTGANTTQTNYTVITRNSNLHYHISNLAYVGPMFMGIGAFIIIIACVVVFETRDKVFELINHQRMTSLKQNLDFYDIIVENMKMREEEGLSGKSIFSVLH